KWRGARGPSDRTPGQVQAGFPGRPERGQDEHHHPVHVRQLRQELPSDHRDRLSLKDYVFGRPDGAASALGYRGTGAFPLPHPQLYQRLIRGGDRLRHHESGELPEHKQVDRGRPQRARERRSDDAGRQ
ncbi:unnamed protein product, partial [Ectocarpus fasciculatus]